MDISDALPRNRQVRVVKRAVGVQRAWIAGEIDAHTEILEGLDAAPAAIRYLYEGRNHGRLCVRPSINR